MVAPPHVLLVDNGQVHSLIVSRMLNFCRVTSVGSGAEALLFLNAGNNVNLILTGYYMHGMSGFDLLKQVKESLELKHIPVVMAFEDENYEDVKRCMDAGAKAYLFKPIKLEDVSLILNSI